jgi:hypothetical protein
MQRKVRAGKIWDLFLKQIAELSLIATTGRKLFMFLLCNDAFRLSEYIQV